MKNTVVKAILPVALTVGSLGLGFAATAPASAATRQTHAKTHAKTHTVTAISVTGTIKRVNPATTTFWLSVGTKTYVVQYKKATFRTASATKLVEGESVTTTGRLAGKSKNVIVATSVTG
ncbi:MAG: hypothetical protein ACYCRG_03685 [Acidimicrobiales bacterium]